VRRCKMRKRGTAAVAQHATDAHAQWRRGVRVQQQRARATRLYILSPFRNCQTSRLFILAARRLARPFAWRHATYPPDACRRYRLNITTLMFTTASAAVQSADDPLIRH